jgi:peroxin-5
VSVFFFSISSSFSVSIHHQAALRQRPEDYALWNKYGATIANSHEGRSAVQTAIEAYFHALDSMMQRKGSIDWM